MEEKSKDVAEEINDKLDSLGKLLNPNRDEFGFFQYDSGFLLYSILENGDIDIKTMFDVLKNYCINTINKKYFVKFDTFSRNNKKHGKFAVLDKNLTLCLVNDTDSEWNDKDILYVMPSLRIGDVFDMLMSKKGE